MNRPLIAFALLALARPALAQEEKTVAIDNFVFAPAKLEVKVGAKVAFVNHDDTPHNIVVDALKKRSRALDTNERYDIVFDRPGEYVYFCGLHPQMTGRIAVTP